MMEQEDGQTQGVGDDGAVSHLLDLCSKQSIHISKKISPRRLPGRGLGIYSTDRILKGERLMHVPTRRLITPSSVPDAFLSKGQQATLPNHALLAAYFAFGLPEGDHHYATWMATWPSVQDFTTSLPVLWPANLLTNTYVPSEHQSKRTRTKSEQSRANKSLLPAPLIDAWSPPLTSPVGSTSSISLLRTKLDKHLSVVASAFPAHSVALLTPQSPLHWRFIHMWCCVNTRCFYYPPPSTSSRSQRATTTGPDPNECLALAPAMDLFNHSSDATARTKYDRTGYFVVADRTYPPGVEIFISYGCHTNDVLWAEYGFMLDQNIDDKVRIDNLLLSSMSSQERLDLSKCDHGEGYWMAREGVSERVTQAAEVTALRGIHQGAKADARSQGVRQKAMKAIIGWMLEMKLDCEDCLKRLASMGQEDVLEVFGSSPDVLRAQSNVPVQELELVREQQAQTRHDMCVKRWKQIAAMVVTVMERCEA